MPLKSSIRAATESISVKWYDDTIVYFGSVIATWLLYFSSMLKIETFSPIFPLTDSIIEASYLVIPLEFQERKHQPFLMTQPLFFEIPNKTKSLLWNVIVSSPQYGEKTAFFLQFFRWLTLRLRYFIGYPCGTSRNAASSISYDTAQKTECLSHIFSKEKDLYNCWVMQNANHVLRQGSLKGLR